MAELGVFHDRGWQGRPRGKPLAALLILVACLCWGCGKSPPAVTDLSQTPWLDPKAQIKSLKDGNMQIRGIAAHHLGNMGAAAAEAIPELEKLAANDPEPKVRDLSKEAVEKIRAAPGSE